MHFVKLTLENECPSKKIFFLNFNFSTDFFFDIDFKMSGIISREYIKAIETSKRKYSFDPENFIFKAKISFVFQNVPACYIQNCYEIEGSLITIAVFHIQQSPGYINCHKDAS